MNRIFTKAIAPTLFVVGSLGMGVAVVAAPASAATKSATVTAKTYSGSVKAVTKGKDVFTLTSGTTTYTVDFTKGTKFTTGSASSLKAGVAVSVTGKLSKSIISATSIKA